MKRTPAAPAAPRGWPIPSSLADVAMGGCAGPHRPASDPPPRSGAAGWRRGRRPSPHRPRAPGPGDGRAQGGRPGPRCPRRRTVRPDPRLRRPGRDRPARPVRATDRRVRLRDRSRRRSFRGPLDPPSASGPSRRPRAADRPRPGLGRREGPAAGCTGGLGGSRRFSVELGGGAGVGERRGAAGGGTLVAAAVGATFRASQRGQEIRAGLEITGPRHQPLGALASCLEARMSRPGPSGAVGDGHRTLEPPQAVVPIKPRKTIARAASGL